MKRSAFFISDGTGITAETLGQSLLAQFENITFNKFTRPYIDTVDKARTMVQQINLAAERDTVRPIIFDTIVNQEIREILATSNGFMIDIFSTFLAPLEMELSAHSSYSVGKSHSIAHNANYMERIEAVNFALDNDDGARTHYYDKADLILVGVSRCGKTPTCLYMAMQFGIRAANYPLTEDDMERLQLSAALKAHQHKLFGLTIDPDRLTAIRHERKPTHNANSKCARWRPCFAAKTSRISIRHTFPWKRYPRRSSWKKASNAGSSEVRAGFVALRRAGLPIGSC
jgi:regulator of PEP synthase PpsR (kinase-PPPase family)